MLSVNISLINWQKTPPPSDVVLQRFMDLKIVERKEDKYTLSDTLKKTIEDITLHPPTPLEGIKLAKDIAVYCKVVVGIHPSLKNEKGVKKISSIILIMMRHFTRLNLKRDLSEPLIYGLLYFDDYINLKT